jgi:hypothetical protein
MDQSTHVALRKIPWNKGKLVGQKAPLKLKDIWGDPGTTPDRPPDARAGTLQPRHILLAERVEYWLR